MAEAQPIERHGEIQFRQLLDGIEWEGGAQ